MSQRISPSFLESKYTEKILKKITSPSSSLRSAIQRDGIAPRLLKDSFLQSTLRDFQFFRLTNSIYIGENETGTTTNQVIQIWFK
jgi:hypothetical protein